MLKRISPEHVVNLDSVLSAELYLSEVSKKWTITLQLGSEEGEIIAVNFDFATRADAESALDKLAITNED